MLSILSYLRQGEYMLALISILSSCFVVFCCLPVHELAHGWVAYKLGDTTAKDEGRGFSHSNRITDGNAFFRNKILIMQRGATDGGARQMNAFQHSGRGQHPGTTYGDLNIQQLCFFLLRRVLESNGPFGEFGSRAKGLPLVKIIYFNDSAVNIVFQIAPRQCGL